MSGNDDLIKEAIVFSFAAATFAAMKKFLDGN